MQNIKMTCYWVQMTCEQETMFLIIEEAKETILDFSQGTVRVLKIYFTLI